MHGLAFDIAHLLAGGMVLVSFLLLYQDRLYALINVFALHSLVLVLAVGWQATIQDAHHLYVTAGIALVFKAIIIPTALHRIVRQLGIHRTLEVVGGVGRDMLAGTALVALAILVMLPVTAGADALAREDLAFALAVVLLGLLAHGHPPQRGQPGGRLHVAGERAGAGRRRGARHAAGGGDQHRVLGADRADRDRRLSVPHPGALRQRGHAGDGYLPGGRRR
jgi:hypothetical protein